MSIIHITGVTNDYKMLDNDVNTIDADDIPLKDAIIERWSLELTNRRQYLSYLKILLEEIKILKDKIYHLNDNIQIEFKNLKALVSNRASIPKEVVYPRFDALGNYIDMLTYI